jgi:hypothetical protein
MLALPLFCLLRFCLYRVPTDLQGAGLLLIYLGLYLAARRAGEGVFKWLLPFVIVEAVSVIALGLLRPGVATGGLVFGPNYNMAAGFMLLGALTNRGKYQGALLALVAVACYFTGGFEALFLLAVLGLTLLLRRDWSKGLLLAGALGAVALLLALLSGALAGLWGRGLWERDVTVAGTVFLNLPLLSGRWEVYEAALRNLAPLGHGFLASGFSVHTVHNVPLIIADQLGPGAALAWALAAGYLLLRSRWTYAWVLFLAAGAWDHYTWTQWGPFFYILAGVSTASPLISDRILSNKQERRDP